LRRASVVALYNIVDVFRAHSRFEEIEVNADLPNYCCGIFIWKPPRKVRAGWPVHTSLDCTIAA
jgi:hypothetical protein